MKNVGDAIFGVQISNDGADLPYPVRLKIGASEALLNAHEARELARELVKVAADARPRRTYTVATRHPRSERRSREFVVPVKIEATDPLAAARGRARRLAPPDVAPMNADVQFLVCGPGCSEGMLFTEDDLCRAWTRMPA